MPRAFLIKKHHHASSATSKRKYKVINDVVLDDDKGFHLGAKDYVKKSLASDSGSETCSTTSNSPSPQPSYYYPRHQPFLARDDDVAVNATAAAAAWVARSSLVDVYTRSANINPWLHGSPLITPSYIPSLHYSTLRQHQYSNYYGYPLKTSPPPSTISPSSGKTNNENLNGKIDGHETDRSTSSCSNSSGNIPIAIDMIKKTSDDSNDEWIQVNEPVVNIPADGTPAVVVTTGRRRGTDGPRYNCPDCNKSYSTHSGLSKHQQFHCATNNKRSFSCKYCDKIYVSLGALKMHIRTHTLPCACKLCGKAFSRPWLLQGHIRTHTGEKPFSCPHCNRAFADRSNLRAHLQTHSDIKKYSCKTCAKTFSRMSLLLKHEDGGCGMVTAATFDGRQESR